MEGIGDPAATHPAEFGHGTVTVNLTAGSSWSGYNTGSPRLGGPGIRDCFSDRFAFKLSVNGVPILGY
jgi:hypothetical protein